MLLHMSPLHLLHTSYNPHCMKNSEKLKSINYSGMVATADKLKSEHGHFNTRLNKSLSNFRASGQGDGGDIPDADEETTNLIEELGVVDKDASNKRKREDEEDEDRSEDSQMTESGDEDDLVDGSKEAGLVKGVSTKRSLTVFSSEFADFCTHPEDYYAYKCFMKLGMTESVAADMPREACSSSSMETCVGKDAADPKPSRSGNKNLAGAEVLSEALTNLASQEMKVVHIIPNKPETNTEKAKLELTRILVAKEQGKLISATLMRIDEAEEEQEKAENTGNTKRAARWKRCVETLENELNELYAKSAKK